MNDTIKYFSLQEMTATSVRVKNYPTSWQQIDNLIKLAHTLDLVRGKLGKPIKVNSAFRSPFVNAAVKGSNTSAHMKGLAADICAWSQKECDNRKLAAIIIEFCNYDQLIIYHERVGVPSSKIRFIHLGLSLDNPRKQIIHK
jgi:hypothetical protein